MTIKVLTPFLGTNDREAVLIDWLVAPGTQVSAGEEVCTLETTKAAVEVQCHADGYFFPSVEAGTTVKVEQVIGFISSNQKFDVEAHLLEEQALSGELERPTKKAELLMRRHGLSKNEVAAFSKGKRVTEASVNSFLASFEKNNARIGLTSGVKVGIIGGVSGGGALIIADMLSHIPGVQAAAIYDRDEQFHGKRVLGVPVVGTMDKLDHDIENCHVDVVVIAFNRDLEERHKIFTDLSERGVKFINIIDPKADIRSNVEIGVGNVIFGHVYVGACSVIGDNNFISANVSLEHGNILGTSCAFGPGVFTSGNVTIGDRVRFGTGIYAEPGITIGDDSVIGSGQTLLTDIQPGTLLTSRAKA